MCKFFSGAFFLSAAIFFYLYLACVLVPILGMGFTATLKCDNVTTGRTRKTYPGHPRRQ